jgi:uncharacterized protein
MSKNTMERQKESGATAVITHRVSEVKQAQYEEWLNEIAPACRASQGLLDWHIIRPIKGLTDTYTVIIRYDTHQNLKNWMDSESRKRLISKVQVILAGKDDYKINSGLDFLFNQSTQNAKVPVRWKQFFVTWSAIFPLVICVPLGLIPLLRFLKLPENHYIDTLLLTGIVVALMVYLVMPRYTKLVRHWLFD